MILELFNRIQENNLSLVIELISNGVEINAKDDIGKTALLHASEFGYKELAELLINHGAK